VSTQTCQQLMTFVKLGFLCNFIAIFVVTPCFNRHIAYATLSFSDVCEKQFPSLQSAKERLEPYWKEILNRYDVKNG